MNPMVIFFFFFFFCGRGTVVSAVLSPILSPEEKKEKRNLFAFPGSSFQAGMANAAFSPDKHSLWHRSILYKVIKASITDNYFGAVTRGNEIIKGRVGLRDSA